MLLLVELFVLLIKKTLSVSVHVVFDDTSPRMQESEANDDKISQIKITEKVSKAPLETTTVESTTVEAESTTLGDKGNFPRE